MSTATVEGTPVPARAAGGGFKWVLAMLGLAFALGIAVGAYNIVRGPIFESLRWAQLAPLPAAATHLQHTSHTEHGAYVEDVTFEAPPPAVDAWLERSPSVRKAPAPSVEAGRRHYKLQPLKLAAAADLYVDPSGKVELTLEHR